jgi:hypothetical protein
VIGHSDAELEERMQQMITLGEAKADGGGWFQMSAFFAARPASHERPPTTTKDTAAIQASESDSLFVRIATKIVNAAIAHMEAIVRPHQ